MFSTSNPQTLTLFLRMQRYKICEEHANARFVELKGLACKFCKHCGRFQPLDAFDGDRKGCRAMLAAHNERRKRRIAMQETTSSLGYSHHEESAHKQLTHQPTQSFSDLDEAPLIFKSPSVPEPEALQEFNPLMSSLQDPLPGFLKRPRHAEMQTSITEVPSPQATSQLNSSFLPSVFDPLSAENVMLESSNQTLDLSDPQSFYSYDVEDIFDLLPLPEPQDLPASQGGTDHSHLQSATATAANILRQLESKSSGEFDSMAMHQLSQLHSALQQSMVPLPLSMPCDNTTTPRTACTSILSRELNNKSEISIEELAAMALTVARHLRQAALDILKHLDEGKG